MTRGITDAIERAIKGRKRAASARRRFLERIRNAPDRGTKGDIRLSRAELHGR